MIDGDTLEIHGERIRILDIDAPETRQPCQDQDGAEWRCGQKAALALDYQEALAANNGVSSAPPSQSKVYYVHFVINF